MKFSIRNDSSFGNDQPQRPTWNKETAMSGFDTLIFEKKEAVGVVTLHRPEAMNAYSVGMRDDLFDVLSAIRADSDLRVVVFRGAGDKAFCAGADLSEFLSAPPPVAARTVRFQRDVWGLFLSIDKPMIAALHGYVLGSGIEIALCCDIRIAEEKTKFGLPEMGLGIIPAACGTQTLPRTIGASPSLEMLLTDRWIDSAEALRLNLVTSVVPNQTVTEAAMDLAGLLAQRDPDALRMTKLAVRNGMDLPMPQGLKMERRLAGQLLGRNG